MQIINSWDKLKDLAKVLPKDKKIVNFPFLGYFHEGHYRIIKEVKKNADILILEYNDLKNFLTISFWDRNYINNYKQENIHTKIAFPYILNYMSRIHNLVDFLVLIPLPEHEKLIKIDNRIYSDLLSIKTKVTEELNLPYPILIETMYMHLSNPIQDCITADMTGPKNALQFMLHNKFFGHKYIKSYDPDVNKHVIWKMIVNDEGEAYTRSKIDLSFIRPKAVSLLKNGKRDEESFKRLLYGLLMHKTFTIIDLESLERIHEVTDNCVLVYGSATSYEIIFMINGEVI